jgi:hypothetical protein
MGQIDHLCASCSFCLSFNSVEVGFRAASLTSSRRVGMLQTCQSMRCEKRDSNSPSTVVSHGDRVYNMGVGYMKLMENEGSGRRQGASIIASLASECQASALPVPQLAPTSTFAGSGSAPEPPAISYSTHISSILMHDTGLWSSVLRRFSSLLTLN